MSRVFKAVDRHGAEMEFELLEPTLQHESRADMERLKAYSAALNEGILPRAAMQELLREHGIWDDESEDNLTKVVKRVALLEHSLETQTRQGKTEECTNTAGDLSKARLDMFRQFMVQQTVLTNSCEGYAEAIKLDAMMAFCTVVKATQQPYWETYKAYVEERDFNTKSTVAMEAQVKQSAILEGERDKIVAEYPEQKWLKDLTGQLAAQMDSELKRAEKEFQGKVDDAIVKEKGEVDGEGDQDTPEAEGPEAGSDEESQGDVAGGDASPEAVDRD